MQQTRLIDPSKLDAETREAYRARYSLEDYATLVHGYRPARHHLIWLREVERAVLDDSPEPIVLVFDSPPGHAKSSYLSEVLPCWLLGRWPAESVLHFTSTDNLAGLYHAVVDDTLKGESERGQWHRRCFPEEACRPGLVWNFEKGLRLAGAGEKVSYKMSGYGSAVLGLRGKFIIGDDVLTEDKASSELELDRAKRYFDRTVWTRKKPGLRMFWIATRWGYDDLTAHLQDKYGRFVKMVHMPALGYWDGLGLEGEALWPEYIPKAALLADLDAMGYDQFLTIFQGEPGNPEGNQLNPDLVQQIPEDWRERCTSVVQAWDVAFTARNRSDYTVCATLGTDRNGNLYLPDMLEARMSEHQFELALEVQYAMWGPSTIGIEKVAAMEWLVQALENKTLLPIQGVQVGIQSKEQRANLLATKVQQGRVYADKRAKWWPRLAQQWREFPKGKHDDMVDAASLAVHVLLGRQLGLIKSSQYIKIGGVHQEHRSRWMEWRRKNRRIAVPSSGRPY